MAVIDWWNGPLSFVVIFFTLCLLLLLLLTWSIAGVACRTCHSSGLSFFIMTHTHTQRDTQHTHTHTHTHTCACMYACTHSYTIGTCAWAPQPPPPPYHEKQSRPSRWHRNCFQTTPCKWATICMHFQKNHSPRQEFTTELYMWISKLTASHRQILYQEIFQSPS